MEMPSPASAGRLIALARRSIFEQIERSERRMDVDARSVSDDVLLPIDDADTIAGAVPGVTGAFVTVRVRGDLRGCIGFLELQRDLGATIVEAARRSAAEDPRFAPLTREEFPSCEVDITLLGRPEALTDAFDFEIGRHGLILQFAGRRGLLLPQVAVEHGWTREEFLSALCRKTGVPDRCWTQSGAELRRFEGLVIKESSHRSCA
jgi:AmmeMemoRadiSam system protein A